MFMYFRFFSFFFGLHILNLFNFVLLDLALLSCGLLFLFSFTSFELLCLLVVLENLVSVMEREMKYETLKIAILISDNLS